MITESVTGITKAAPTPIAARSAINSFGEWSEDRRERGEPEEGEAEDEHRLAAEPVAERTGGKEQRRECERVRGDDPLQLRLRRAGVAPRAPAARR